MWESVNFDRGWRPETENLVWQAAAKRNFLFEEWSKQREGENEISEFPQREARL